MKHLIAFLFVASATAQTVSPTLVQGSIESIAGSFTGTGTITGPTMSCGGTLYVAAALPVTITNGIISVSLPPNDQIGCQVMTGDRPGYRVTLKSATRTVEFWLVVPTSADPVTPAAIYSSGPPPVAPLSISPTSIARMGAINGNVLGFQDGSWRPVSALVDPTTTQGDLMVRGPGGLVRMPKGANGSVFGVDSSGNVGYLATLDLSLFPSIPNSKLTNSSVTITPGTGLTGGGSAALGGSTTISANIGIGAGTVAAGNDSRIVGAAQAAALAASTGAGAIGYIAPGTGAVAQTIETAVDNIVSATNYGAVGNGTWNDTNAIQAAIDAAYASQVRSVVQLPAGRYPVCALQIKTSVALVGPSSSPGPSGHPVAALLQAPGCNDDVIKSPTTGYLHGTRIEDIEIVGDPVNNTAGRGINLYRLGENSWINRVHVSQMPSDGIRIYDYSAPLHIGSVGVYLNGQSGSGSGIVIEGSQATQNQIDFVSGDNNKDALIKASGTYNAGLTIWGFKSERSPITGGGTSGNGRVIWVHNGNGGIITIGTGHVMVTGVPDTVGDAIIYQDADAGNSVGRVNVLGGIQMPSSLWGQYQYGYWDATNSRMLAMTDVVGKAINSTGTLTIGDGTNYSQCWYRGYLAVLGSTPDACMGPRGELLMGKGAGVNPSPLAINSVNFPGTTGGAWISVNSRFVSGNTWQMVSNGSVSTRGLFMGFSPLKWSVRFGDADNTGGQTPGTEALSIVDNGAGSFTANATGSWLFGSATSAPSYTAPSGSNAILNAPSGQFAKMTVAGADYLAVGSSLLTMATGRRLYQERTGVPAQAFELYMGTGEVWLGRAAAATTAIGVNLTHDGTTSDLKVDAAGDTRINGALYSDSPVIAKVANYTLTDSDRGMVFTNTGATGSVTLTTYTTAAKRWNRFCVDAAQTLTVAVPSGTTIQAPGAVSASGGNITSNQPGSCVELQAISASKVVAFLSGTWTVN